MAATGTNVRSVNHTRINKLSSVHLNPKFEKRRPKNASNFGVGTLATRAIDAYKAVDEASIEVIRSLDSMK